jgi:hypothetical protein
MGGHILAFFHMNGQFKWEWMKDMWWVLVGGIPISFLFYYSTRLSYEHFGYFWNIRLIGFGLGTMIFGLLTWFVLNEPPNTRVIISLVLSLIIILIQLTNINLPIK